MAKVNGLGRKKAEWEMVEEKRKQILYFIWSFGNKKHSELSVYKNGDVSNQLSKHPVTSSTYAPKKAEQKGECVKEHEAGRKTFWKNTSPQCAPQTGRN